ncbi:kinesin family protein [Eremomyces bilateralis CBS 781.70]|uniref:Kinesin family protein n=1 Tax=Eremomyces bilateralis CBS 781.70 TaxID=1392243 RepID=A0A6G1GGN9_9PEZI|nr:kinesin family protein [Eremomyces bilateralis CBS 781.70]KAF1817071.1 kinesin family protein [Eremomyces bilateralis CBS 781.70]
MAGIAASPPGSPPEKAPRPMSVMVRPNRSASRMSTSSRQGGSRASDEDSKTSVKVAVRVRPPIRPGDPGFELIPQRFRGSTAQVTSQTSLTVESAQGKKLFVFDRVFGEDINQEGVWEYLSESVNHFVQGYNVSILAYGQSGAGKSYTMGTTGPQEQNDATLMGVVPRAAAALFERLTGSSGDRNTTSGIKKPQRYSTHGLQALQNAVSKSADKNWQMKATYVEIYNEQLRDLLLDETVPMNERPQVLVREDPKGRIFLNGLKQVSINSISDLLDALNFGSSIRQTDATAVNAKSSRSHAVFSLNLIQKRSNTPKAEKRRSMPIESMSASENWVTVDSKLHFVDLAGSERLKNTGAHGDRAKEGISINAGLASLGKVISQLSSRQPGSHVSYRDSRLTRLLQDSLGGNAITYMVACINPAEFHLSETLNTVQYAQRARAIQSKPQIQQVADDSDRHAVIERLRAEISFLRDQIRLSERTGGRSSAPQERAERSNTREVELQNQLLDIQENYGTLSQRHARLISEITKARDSGDMEDTPLLKDTIGESAVDRLKRSTSFGEAVEQVVLEYEKTIQSLESSLATTRASLASSESTLLEKETKIAYMDTVTQQLQARIQKAMDREANDETYLRDIESRLSGATSGEEKSSAIVQSLKKELTRARDNEASCEEYISTLEERLAESEQDHEMMQREIERLEHVVERQRSIGKLDTLLYELDTIRQGDSKAEQVGVNGHDRKQSEGIHSIAEHEDDEQLNGDAEHSDDGNLEAPELDPEVNSQDKPETLKMDTTQSDDDQSSVYSEAGEAEPVKEPKSSEGPSQSRFVADKLDTVTHELIDLRMEHEVTLNDYDELTRKYKLALRTLAELQDAVDEARNGRDPLSANSTRPTSVVQGSEANGIAEDGQPSTSRTLSSELWSVGESQDSIDPSEAETAQTSAAATVTDAGEEVAEKEKVPEKEGGLLAQEMDNLRKLAEEKEKTVAELRESHAELQEQHQDMLDYVEELKAEVQKAQLVRPSSPSPVIRRKSSQTVLSTDRATRSFASLRNIALENLETDPDALQNFELNINAVMTELHMRSERVSALETELAAVRKEMEAKMAIISGLTRERSSLKSSPLDISVVAQLRDQLIESERQMRALQEGQGRREKELMGEIAKLRAEVGGAQSNGVSGESDGDGVRGDDDNATQVKVVALQTEVVEWKSKHDASVESMKQTEAKLLATINELEASLQKAEATHSRETSAGSNGSLPNHADQTDLISALRKEIDEHRSVAAANAARLAQLEDSHAKILSSVEEDTQARELTEKELQTHRGLVRNLEGQIEEHMSTIKLHQEGLESLRESHSKEVEELNASALAAQTEASQKLLGQLEELKQAQAVLQEQLATTQEEHRSATEVLKSELSNSQTQLLMVVASISDSLNKDATVDNVHEHVRALADERKALLEKHEKAASQHKEATDELESVKQKIGGLESNVSELKMINDETLKELELVSEKERKSSRLVEELEEQLNSNFDSHQAANNRLSAMQTERQMQLTQTMTAKADLERELEEARSRITGLESQLDGRRHSQRASLQPGEANDLQRSNSNTSTSTNLRKSTSHTSLPSPPPAIPLPPLPGNPPANSAPSPPTSRHQSKDIAAAQLAEDQEARIRTIEKHLFAEKQLTATLEEALTDLETSSTKLKSEMDGWRRKCISLEEELTAMRKERNASRLSVQQLEEEQRSARMRIEAEKANLEARMAQLAAMNKKGKKKSGLNCF